MNSLQEFYNLKHQCKEQSMRNYHASMKKCKNLKEKFMAWIFTCFLTISLMSCGKPIPSLTYKQIPNQWKSPRQIEPKDYKGFYHCNNIAVCLSQKDFQFEVIQKKRSEDAIKELIKIIEDDNERYMEYLSASCGWFDFQCKKDRKKTKIIK